MKYSWVGLLLVVLTYNCKNASQDPATISSLFSELTSDSTHILFENKVVQQGENNILNYSYYFNGGGVAVFDANNDGLQDIYFTGNVVENTFYLNRGNMKFEDQTLKAGLSCRDGWKTGVTVVDINKDGWLDLYVCRSAMGDSVLRKNLLFINNHDLTFTEKAREYGLDHAGYSTQAAFFDFDKDGDDDVFILNHSLPEYTKFNNLRQFLATKESNFASRLFENQNGIFKDISDKAGIANNVLSFGLSIAISDLNNDGWLDMYVSNDFNEQDYMYINTQNGSFTNKIKEYTDHISLFSMGSDVADINNDMLPDFITLDMMPYSNERIKLSSGDDNYDKNQVLEDAGLHHQTMRNMLHLNNGNGSFSEIGQLAGVSNTDWSWASLFSDFDGDGYKDLYISNGYEKDFTNMQFLKFTVDARIKSKQTGEQLDMNMILANLPSIEEGNYLFKNEGLNFTPKTNEWGLGRKFKSNGAAIADLDNDGDPDLVINIMNQKSTVLKNNASEQKIANFIKIDLLKENTGRALVGTKIFAYTGDTKQFYEFGVSRGFQSSMFAPVTIGINKSELIDSIQIKWPDNKSHKMYNVKANTTLYPKWNEASELHSINHSIVPYFTIDYSLLKWKQEPPVVNDFKQQLLLPKMYSYTGPKMIKGDANNDGLEDLFICAPAGQASTLLIQTKQGGFHESNAKIFETDKAFSDEDALFFDADADGDDDLYVVSGNYNVQITDRQDRLYINNGKGIYSTSEKLIPAENENGSVVHGLDIDNDKDMDLFIGGAVIPGKYPLSQESKILINDGKGSFTVDSKNTFNPLEVHLVSDAVASDLNKDGLKDLIIVGEWMGIKVYINENGKLMDQSDNWVKTPNMGWWHTISAADFDHDGDEDFLVGNAGLNNQFKVTYRSPIHIVYKDFDKNGQIDPFINYYIDGVSFPYASRDEALGQVGFLRNRFLDYNSYSNVKLSDIFTKEELEGAEELKADQFQSVYLENTGTELKIKPLPIQAQYAPVYTILAMDIDRDQDDDIILAGNECNVRVRLGRSDANKGFVFLNDGKGNFAYVDQSIAGLNLKDDTRQLLAFKVKNKDVLLIGQTSKPILTYNLK